MGRRSRSQSSSSSSDSVRLDQFGRVIPKKRKRSRSGSRSRNRTRAHSRSSRSSNRSQRRTRSRSRSRPVRSRPVIVLRSRSRSRSRSKSARGRKPRRVFRRDSHDRLVSCSPESRSPTPPTPPKPTKGRNETNLHDPELMKARVFIGNLPFDKITKEELETMFSKYGKILGISIHEKGFGFVQFSKEAEGLEAVKNENGGLLKGRKIDVKMALEGRRSAGKRSPPPYDRGYSMSGGGRGPPSARPGAAEASDRYSVSGAGRGPPPARPGAAEASDSYPPLAPNARERSPLRADPYEDRYRDPYRDPALPPAPRREDPYYDTYRRPPADDPYYDRYRDDPYRYRRDPYADPYRDPYYRRDEFYDTPPPPRKPLPIDCEIIALNGSLKNFAEFLERKLKALNMTVHINTIPEDSTIPQAIEDASKRQVLFAVVINSQNEVHQSLTLNILHGTPQEHRNMPVEDAITLVNRSFEQYLQTAREKTASAAPAGGLSSLPPAQTPRQPAASTPFVPPSADISYLLNLLADSRQLTIDELEKVINYLRERRDKLMEREGRRPDDGRASAYGGAGDRKEEAAALNQQQQELQAKILSILNGPGDDNQRLTDKRMAPHPGGMGNGAHQQAGGQSGMSSLINFDSPSVQKALDNLIQSGPNLLKNISSPQGGASVTQQGALMARHGGEPMRREPPPQGQGMMMRDQGYGMVGAGGAGSLSGAGAQQRSMYSNANMGSLGSVPRPPAGAPPSRRPY